MMPRRSAGGQSVASCSSSHLISAPCGCLGLAEELMV